MAEADPTRVACITGTKGKSTTTALAVHLLTGLGYGARAGGNIGQPPWDPSDEPDPDYWVIETSSFQVPDLTTAPRVVAVTSLSPDHLDWHGTVERYYADKLSLCTKPGVDAGPGRRLRRAAPRAGGAARPAPALGHRAPRSSATRAWSDALGPPGPPQRAQRLHRPCRARRPRDPRRRRRRAAGARRPAGFGGLPSRCHSLGAVGAVEFVDDSLSTNVLPAQAALRRLRRAAGRAAGGRPRPRRRLRAAGPDRRRRARRRRSSSPCPTTARASARPSATPATGAVEVVDAAGASSAAVEAAFGWATAGGVVLLSPAAPSFGRFADYRERSAAFAGGGRPLRSLS